MSSGGGRGDGETSDQGDWMRSGLNAQPPRQTRRWAAVGGGLATAAAIVAGTGLVLQDRGGDIGATAPPPATSMPTGTAPTTTSPDEPGDGGAAGGPTAPSPSTSPTTALPPGGPGPAPGFVEAGGPGGYAYVRELPGLSSEVVANLPHGTAVLIVCTTRGDVVVSPDGRGSDLWNYIAPTDLGPAGFIPDAWVYTGTDEPTRPECA